MKENREVWKGITAQDHDALKITMKELRENNKCKSTAAISCTHLFKGKTISCTSMRPSNGCHAVTLSVILWDYLSPGRLGKNVTAAF